MGNIQCIDFIPKTTSAQYTKQRFAVFVQLLVRKRMYLRKIDLPNTLVVISLGLLFLIVSILVIATGNVSLQLGINAVMTPLVALFLGVSGIRIYGKEYTTRSDKFYTMNLWFAIGLIMLSLAEIGRSIISFTLNTSGIILIVALIQLPGLLLWGIGIIQYLRSLNSAMDFIPTDTLWTILFFIVTISTAGLILINAILFPTIGFFENIVLSPIIVGLAVFSVSNAILVWVFRKGSLSQPLFLIFGALGLYLIRCIFWLFTSTALESPTDGLIAIESFILCGAALQLARDL